MSAQQRRRATGYRHDALLYHGDDEFVSRTASFVREGIELGEPVMVAVVSRRLGLLREALGPDADQVRFVDMEQLGANPAHIIPCWRNFIALNEGHPMRGVGEPIWLGRRPEEIVECQLHEALLNLVLDPDTPMWLACPYDVGALGSEVLAEAHRSHPAVIDGEKYYGSSSYGGLHHVHELFDAELPAPAQPAPEHVLSRSTVEAAGDAVRRHARERGIDAAKIDGLIGAVDAIGRDSLTRGASSGHDGVTLRIWSDARLMSVEISDHGQIVDPLIGRIEPLDDAGGQAVWLANESCDLVQIRSGRHGTVVRLLTWL